MPSSTKSKTIRPEFVTTFPRPLQPGILYISTEFNTTAHQCPCGCGREVIAPLASHRWSLIYDGKASLHPSIGNWRFPCKSHYWIRRNRIAWSYAYTTDEIDSAEDWLNDRLDEKFGNPDSERY